MYGGSSFSRGSQLSILLPNSTILHPPKNKNNGNINTNNTNNITNNYKIIATNNKTINTRDCVTLIFKVNFRYKGLFDILHLIWEQILYD